MAAAQSATGDLKNNLMKLLREIQRMKLRVEPNVQGLCLGAPSSILPILHQSLMHYSLPLASWLSRQDYELYGKSDLRFVEGVYKVLREVFHYHPCLTKEQFLSVGYAERKLQMTTDLLRACQAKHRELDRRTGRPGRRGQRTFHLMENGMSTTSEVLTVQNTSGISSAWTEPLSTHVHQLEKEDGHHPPQYTPPSSPESSPSPTFTHHRSTLTPPSPSSHSHTHTTHLHSSPISLSPPHTSHTPPDHGPRPMVVRHEFSTKQVVAPISEGGPQKFISHSGGLTDNQEQSMATAASSAGVQKNDGSVGEAMSSSSSSSAEETVSSREHGGRDGGKEKLSENGQFVPTQGKHRERPSHTEQVLLAQVNERVQQLAMTVERMSARLVLLETQLKTLQGERREETQEKGGSGDGGGGGEGGGEQKAVEMKGKVHGLPLPSSLSRVESVGSEVPLRREEGQRSQVRPVLHGPQQRHIPAAAVSMATVKPSPSGKSTLTFVPPTTTSTPHTITSAPNTITSIPHTITSTSHTITSTPHTITSAPHAIISTTPAITSAPHVVTSTPHTVTSAPHMVTSTPHTVTPAPHTGVAHKISRSQPGSALSSQLAALRAETQQLATPSTLSPAHVHTPAATSFTRGLSVFSPSTPEDTRRMIASLRDRAQRTKDFLRQANKKL